MTRIRSILIASGCSCLFLPVFANPAHGSSFSDMCSEANGVVRISLEPPDYYIESVSQQQPETRFGVGHGSEYRIESGTQGGWSEAQKAQSIQLKNMARIAYLTRSGFRVCVTKSTRPYTVRLMELK